MKFPAHGHITCMEQFSFNLVPACFRGGVELGASRTQHLGRLSLEVVYVRAGSVRYALAGRSTMLHTGALGVFWGGIPHVRMSSADADVAWFSIPLARLLVFDLGRGFLHRLMRGDFLSALAMDWHMPCDQWVADLAGGDPFVRRTVEIELEACLLRFGRKYDAYNTLAAHAVPEQLYDMLAYLYDNHQEELTPLDVAEEVGLPLARAQSVFRQFYGVSISTFLQRLRLWYAQARLTNSNDTVLRIALEAGFGSLPRFYVAFKEAFGIAPGHYRRQLRQPLEAGVRWGHLAAMGNAAELLLQGGCS